MQDSRPEFCEQIASKCRQKRLPAATEGVCNQELVLVAGGGFEPPTFGL